MVILYRGMWIQPVNALTGRKKTAAGNLIIEFPEKFAELIIEKGSICCKWNQPDSF